MILSGITANDYVLLGLRNLPWQFVGNRDQHYSGDGFPRRSAYTMRHGLNVGHTCVQCVMH